MQGAIHQEQDAVVPEYRTPLRPRCGRHRFAPCHVLYGKMFPVMDGARAAIKLLCDFTMILRLVIRPPGGLTADNLFLGN